MRGTKVIYEKNYLKNCFFETTNHFIILIFGELDFLDLNFSSIQRYKSTEITAKDLKISFESLAPRKGALLFYFCR